MSAFIVQNQTMHLAVQAMSHKEDTQLTRSKLGNDLYLLNQDAVNQRYQDPNRCFAQGYVYRHQSATHVQQFKALECLAYQCHEGDVPDRPLYQRMRETLKQLAFKIVRAMPEYDKSPWDFPDNPGVRTSAPGAAS